MAFEMILIVFKTQKNTKSTNILGQLIHKLQALILHYKSS